MARHGGSDRKNRGVRADGGGAGTFFHAVRDGDGFRRIISHNRKAGDAEGNFITDWETTLGGTYSTGVAVNWRTIRAWKNRVVIAERIEDLSSRDAKVTP